MKLKTKSIYTLLSFSLFYTILFASCNNNDTNKTQVKLADTNFPIVVQVKGMYCQICSKNLERYVSELNEVDSVYASTKVRIKIKDGYELTKKKISDKISEAGYEAEVFIKHPENTTKE